MGEKRLNTSAMKNKLQVAQRRRNPSENFIRDTEESQENNQENETDLGGEEDERVSRGNIITVPEEKKQQ